MEVVLVQKVTVTEFLENAPALLVNAAYDDEATEITLSSGGTAILLSLQEWKSMRDTMALLFAQCRPAQLAEEA